MRARRCGLIVCAVLLGGLAIRANWLQRLPLTDGPRWSDGMALTLRILGPIHSRFVPGRWTKEAIRYLLVAATAALPHSVRYPNNFRVALPII
jgi:hypothetical protein